ncbi:alpha/beta fold hydrolase [Paracraurococcus lichenis]|uniref:Alpha/beta fold hydrolase n=1 Tax=Paracraurococcus lichenis TaxID=3064888 RepID=A0ABT9E915_9PROT|nr:alpha/beta fold hydrolase [Paracraurococcus sp. LOR1-02]MDO9712675.1 alpha/beta fold hydrolase [Paracraurococcus sp. LOR1-02]
MSLPTLLIPGLNCSATLFRHQIPLMWRFGAVMVCDHRGADSIAGLAELILVQAPPRFALAGLSMGGFIAFEIMRRCPERVTHLALLSTSARPEVPGGPGAALRAERIAMARSGRFAELPPLHYANNVHPSRQADDALRATHRGMTEEVGPEGYINQQTANMNRVDSRPVLATIQCPTLVLVGDSDRLSPPDHAAEMQAGIRGSTLVVLPECGHLSTLERPEAVGEAMLAWRGRAA